MCVYILYVDILIIMHVGMCGVATACLVSSMYLRIPAAWCISSILRLLSYVLTLLLVIPSNGVVEINYDNVKEFNDRFY